MKALLTVVLAGIIAAAVVLALVLRGPSYAWWRVPAALAALAGTVVVLVAIMVPRGWWR